VKKRGKIKGGEGIFYGWFVLTAAFITVVLGYAIRNSFSVFYPTIVQEFDWGRGSTALMFSISVIIYGLVSPLAGTLVDRFKPRVILPIGSLIAGVGVALCSLASSQWHFFLFYGFIAAIGLSLAGWTPLTAIVSNWFVRRRGLVIGIMAAGFGGSLISASISQFLISNLNWHMAYVIVGLIPVAIIAPLCIILIRRSPQEKGLLPDGMPQESAKSQDPDKPGNGDSKWVATSWTLTRAVKTYQFWLLFLIAFCLLGLAEQIAVAHEVYFFRDAGYEPMPAANIYSVFGIAFIIGTLCSFFSDRLGREKVFIPACIVGAGAVPLLFLIRDTSSLWMPLLFAICFGLGLGAGGPVFYSAAADLFHGKHFGSILGTITIGFSLGGALGPPLAGYLHDITKNYFLTFLIVMGALIMSAVLMWLIAPGKIRPVQR
jgi:sugar phosphate permease